MARYFMIILLCAVTAGAGFVVGRLTAPAPPTVSLAARPPSQPVGISSPKAPAPAPRKPDADPSDRLVKRQFQGDRLWRIAEFLRVLHSADLGELRKLDAAMYWEDREGHELGIERQLLLFRLGQIDGPGTIREKFGTNADVSVRAKGIVFEGWATAEPIQALDWWRSLPKGKMRLSLLGSLTQGLLSVHFENWQLLADSLGPEELNQSAMPLLESILSNSGPKPAMEWFAKMEEGMRLSTASSLARATNEAVIKSGDLESLAKWYTVIKFRKRKEMLAQEHVDRVVAAIGAVGGAKIMECLDSPPPEYASLDPAQRHSLARGWVHAHHADAASWVEAHRDHPSASAVAFQLAIYGVSTDPEASVHWLDYVDAKQRETLSDIIDQYREKLRIKKESEGGK